jgi:putative FmdB family regulatory protein
MPIYEYKCTKCGKEFEVIQKFSDKPVEKCIHCSGKVEKLISQSSFHLKGSGWYATDYASGPKKEKEKKDKKDSGTPPGCAGCPSC